jgi:hypothetical protein
MKFLIILLLVPYIRNAKISNPFDKFLSSSRILSSHKQSIVRSESKFKYTNFIGHKGFWNIK